MRQARVVVAVLLVALSLTFSPGPARAAVLVDDTPAAAWRVDGVTRAVLIVGDTTYVGGSFARATAPNGTTRPRANLAAFHTRTGALVEGFRADTNGVVRSLATDGTRLYVGGSFTSAGGQSRSRLAAVDPATGAVDPTFRPSVNSNVYSLDLRAGRLFVAGSFSSVSGVSRGRAAAVHPASGAVDPSFNPSADGTVLAIRAHPSGATVYLGGEFTAVGGATRTGLAAVSGATGGIVAPTFADTYRPTIDLDMDPTGSRLFAAVGGGGNQAAGYDTATGRRLWRQRADGDVQTVAFHRETVYFGFHESFGGDLTLRMLAADARTGALDPDFAPTFDRYWGLFDLAATDDAVVGAGDFTRVGGVAAQGMALFVSDRPPPPPPPPVATYLDATSTWRFHDSGTLPGPGWEQPGFPDDAFRTGRPELGYGDGDEATVVSFGPSSASKYPVTYFRTTFDVPVRPTSLAVSLIADDGAVVHLNGVEVLRDNVAAGTVTNATLAASGRSGSAESQIRRFPLDPARLVTGTNTIAVSVHQDARSSSDLSFTLLLDGELPVGPTTTTTSTTSTTSTTLAPTTTTTAPPPTTTTVPPTTTTTAPPTGQVLASWSGTGDSFDQYTGAAPTVESAGSHGTRLRWEQGPDQYAFATWSARRLGAPQTQQSLRWVATFSGLPSMSFGLAQGLDESAGYTQRWRLELTSTGRVRVRDGTNAITAESTGARVPVGSEVRFEAVRAGTTMTVSAFAPATATTPLLTVTGTVDGGGSNHLRLGNVLRSPTAPPFTLDEVVLTDRAAPVGPPG